MQAGKNEITRRSPQAADVIRRVCAEKNLQHPRLGLIADGNPTAFTYGTFPNSARLVVSEGLFTYLDDEEVAAVYAHELGHIVNYDFGWMTVAATLVQIMYLVYTLARRMENSGGYRQRLSGGGFPARSGSRISVGFVQSLGLVDGAEFYPSPHRQADSGPEHLRRADGGGPGI